MADQVPHSKIVGRLHVISTPDVRHVAVVNKSGMIPQPLKGWDYKEDHELQAIYDEACEWAKDNQPAPGGGLFG